ncbi:hypothetical protein DAEQUDRAFT_731802 [Daedalea quercina L-15889]|uniref:Uncharacterized protein n=1 Tax=Daedalea quercina L-15889 TaxID=1314783 RepID=A0A165M023_9APHY|nr:hypothetical protein DAEQUDRAFT_731802 [Daedalea quercina L-15889]
MPSLSRLYVDLSPPFHDQPESLVELFGAVAQNTSGLAEFTTLAITTSFVPMGRSGASVVAYHDVYNGAASIVHNSTGAWMDEHTPVVELYSSSVVFLNQTDFDTFCNLLPIRPVQSLIIETNLPQQEIWLDFVQRMPDVTNLCIFGIEDVTALPTMLSCQLPAEQQDGAEDTTCQYVFPHLRTLTLEEESPRGSSGPMNGFVDSLIDCMVERYESGAEIVELRILRLHGMEETLVDKLREVVRSVEWIP